MQPMTPCTVCGSRTQTFLCDKCANEVRDVLLHIPRDLADLRAVETRQASGPLGLGHRRLQWESAPEDGALPVTPWPQSIGAQEQVWAIENTLTTWARDLAETRKVDVPQAPVTVRRFRVDRHGSVTLTVREHGSAEVAAQWLMANLNSIRMDESAAAIHDEITGLARENDKSIVGRGLEVFAGRCDAPDIFEDPDTGQITVTDRICNVALYGHEGEDTVKCDGCGMVYDLAERIEKRDREQINEQLARPHAIANALGFVEDDGIGEPVRYVPLTPVLLRKWIQRDAEAEPSPEGPACKSCGHRTCTLIRRALIIVKGYDDEGHSLYRIGDVRARLELVQAQRGVKLERMMAS